MTAQSMSKGRASNTIAVETSPSDASYEKSREVRREMKKRKKMRRIENRSCFEEAESLQTRYRARRLPPLQPKKIVPVIVEEEEEEDIPIKKNVSQRLIELVVAPKVKVSYELSAEAKRAIKALSLTKRQVNRLFKKYMAIDIDKTNQINKKDFWGAMGVHPSAFSNKIFEMIDSDASGMMDYSEFICVLVTFCCFNKNDVLRFSFDCFDADDSGFIDMSEVEKLVDIIQAQEKPKFTKNIHDALEALRGDDDGQIDFHEFHELNQHYPMLLQPAFGLQDKLQEHTLGEKDWIKILENIHHAEVDREKRMTTFGMPMRLTLGRRVASTLGLVRWWPRMDVDYINDMRPARNSHMGHHHQLTDEDKNDLKTRELNAVSLAEEKGKDARAPVSSSSQGAKRKSSILSSALSLVGSSSSVHNNDSEQDDSSSSSSSRRRIAGGGNESIESEASLPSSILKFDFSRREGQHGGEGGDNGGGLGSSLSKRASATTGRKTVAIVDGDHPQRDDGGGGGRSQWESSLTLSDGDGDGGDGISAASQTEPVVEIIRLPSPNKYDVRRKTRRHI